MKTIHISNCMNLYDLDSKTIIKFIYCEIRIKQIEIKEK